MIYGYCRISTAEQSIERQIRNILKEYPTAEIKQEVYTGTTTNRPIFDKLLKIVKSGDTIVFDGVSRMSRNAEDGYNLYCKLLNDGVNLIFLKEPLINTDTYKQAQEKALPTIQTGTESTDKLLNTIMQALNEYTLTLTKNQIELAFEQSQKEVDDNHKRTSEGMQTAKLNGKQIGAVKGKKLTTTKEKNAIEVIKKHCKYFGGTLADSEVMKLCGISRNSFYKYKAIAKGGVRYGKKEQKE